MKHVAQDRPIARLMDLTGRVVLVTGGAGHVGVAVSRGVAEVGATVVVLDRTAEACEVARDQIRAAADVPVSTIVVDLELEDEVRAAPAKVLAAHGRLDVLVNCAAFVGTSDLPGWSVPFAEQGTLAWRRALEVNLTAPFVLAQACAPALAASGCGSIINVSSIYGVVGPDLRLYEGTSLGNPAAYGAAKAGLLQVTRWLATVLAPTVRVNAIGLGGVWRNQPSAFVDRYEARTPLRRMATEEDVKGTVVYLASDLSAYVTGETVMVDGGWTAW